MSHELNYWVRDDKYIVFEDRAGPLEYGDGLFLDCIPQTSIKDYFFFTKETKFREYFSMFTDHSSDISKPLQILLEITGRLQFHDNMISFHPNDNTLKTLKNLTFAMAKIIGKDVEPIKLHMCNGFYFRIITKLEEGGRIYKQARFGTLDVTVSLVEYEKKKRLVPKVDLANIIKLYT